LSAMVLRLLVQDGKSALVGYNIASMDMLIK
jgi:hypothetical protein